MQSLCEPSSEIMDELLDLYDGDTALAGPIARLWRRTQVREPYSVGELEDLFFGFGEVLP